MTSDHTDSGDPISGGVPMLESLKITDDGATSSSRITDARKLVSEGKTMAESFKQSGKFPTMMLQMINVGEATGTLDEMLSKLANFYDEEVDNAVASLLSILEPILLVFVGPWSAAWSCTCTCRCSLMESSRRLKTEQRPGPMIPAGQEERTVEAERPIYNVCGS
jgi:hypothetical protein